MFLMLIFKASRHLQENNFYHSVLQAKLSKYNKIKLNLAEISNKTLSPIFKYTKSVQYKYNLFEYFENQLYSLDVAWQRALTVLAWPDTLLWGYSTGS